ncbi:hypothetical protein AMATHDRAFT_62758 [Amanita thiersii Skay4041]|uniref:Uncharacterized protein n=1 Tax=Amanita thiersii Skay4041 TaxID=703135 RepID=A0A2A9NG91_9AGAR|nr:hypothetical protein AMATHDRAFT_62758 [Amanita thiersii Skay4041]
MASLGLYPPPPASPHGPHAGSHSTLNRNGMDGGRVKDSTHLIPPPGSSGRPGLYDPLALRWPVIIGTPIILMGLGVCLEIVLAISVKNGGYSLPEKNPFNFVSLQFILSFFPSLIVLPNATLWRMVDWEMRAHEPYVTMLRRDGAPAEQSLLLDYIYRGPVFVLLRSLKFRHKLIFFSSLTAMLTYLFQPLTGSILQVRYSPEVTNVLVSGTKTIGLVSDVGRLDGFLAAAGFAESAVYFNLPDPTYIRNGWAAAEFVLPGFDGFNGTVAFNTTGILTTLHCDNQLKTDLVQVGSSVTIQSTSVGGCVKNVSVDTYTSKEQFGVEDVGCPDDKAALDPNVRPVMFWFLHSSQNGTLQARTVFCSPNIVARQVTTVSDLHASRYITLIGVADITEPNNVTSTGDFAGKTYNGVIFNPTTDPIVQGRAAAIRTGIPSAIMHLASNRVTNLDLAFDNPNTMLNATQDVYLKHLALVANAVYFVENDKQLPAEVTSYVPRLWIDPFPAHILSGILLTTGFIAFVLQLIHRRKRRGLRLASAPGSIASAVSLTAHSGIGERLYPYDDESTMKRKLERFRFKLDERTGAVTVLDTGLGRDDMRSDATESLLKEGGLVTPVGTPSSATFPFQAMYPQT